VHREADKRC